jgi:cytochrome c biogenesis protein CcmG/thiol:disulfide interchange protein DsbE
MNIRWRSILPFLLFLSIALVLWRGLTLHPNIVPSPLVNQPAPFFRLPTLSGKPPYMTTDNFKGHVTLWNVWSTTCAACMEEHAFLLALAKHKSVIIDGLNYKDTVLAAKDWLKKYGNPYTLVAVDATGNTGIDWGVYGTPETFVIDKKGVIRYKQIGAITPDIWEQTLKPLVQQLQDETP